MKIELSQGLVPKVRLGKHVWPAAVVCALSGLIMAIFLQSARFEFVFDDEGYVLRNPLLKDGVSFRSVARAFFSFYFANWHPVTWLSHMLDVQLFGFNPGAHHLGNVFFHALASVSFFVVLRALTGALWRSAAVAVLFAVHPLHVESVAWITERKDTLSAVFWALGVGSYVRYTRNPSPPRYALLLIVFAIGLMSKAMLVTFPFCLILLDWWPLQRLTENPGFLAQLRRLLQEKWPLLILSAAGCVVAYAAQREGSAVQSLELFPLEVRAANAAVAYAAYLGKMVWPVGLAVYYPHPGAAIPLMKIVLSVLVLGSLSFLVLHRKSQEPYLAVGWLWYLGTLLPVIGVVQVGAQSMADRYTYIPSIGIFIAAAWAAGSLTKRIAKRAILGATGFAAAAALLVGMSYRQTEYWRNGEALYRHALEVTSENWLIFNNLGKVLERSLDFDGAIAAYERALRIRPKFEEATLNLVSVLERAGRAREALARTEREVRNNPGSAHAQAKAGELLARSARLVDAEAHLNEAIRLDPELLAAHYDLATLLADSGRWQGARVHLRAALRVQSDVPVIHRDLGIALVKTGELNEALVHFAEAIRQAPQSANFHYNYAVALERGGKGTDAARHYREALRLEPSYDLARRGLARVTAN